MLLNTPHRQWSVDNVFRLMLERYAYRPPPWSTLRSPLKLRSWSPAVMMFAVTPSGGWMDDTTSPRSRRWAGLREPVAGAGRVHTLLTLMRRFFTGCTWLLGSRMGAGGGGGTSRIVTINTPEKGYIIGWFEEMATSSSSRPLFIQMHKHAVAVVAGN